MSAENSKNASDKREPRLLAKQDTSDVRPKVFRHHDGPGSAERGGWASAVGAGGFWRGGGWLSGAETAKTFHADLNEKNNRITEFLIPISTNRD